MLCATIHEGKIIVGCQYGLLVFWDTAMVLAMEKKVVGMHHAAMVLYEHSAAISNIHVDATELITDDYDGIVILRYVATLINHQYGPQEPPDLQAVWQNVPKRISGSKNAA